MAPRGNTEGIIPTDRTSRERRRNRRLPANTRGESPRPIRKKGRKNREAGLNDLVVVSQNIDGITEEKLMALFKYLKQHDVDIMHLQETKAQEPFPEWTFHNGYKIIHHKPANGSKSGGCATLVKQKWGCKQLRTLPEEGDVCWTEVDLGFEKLVSANVYWRTSSQCNQDAFDTLVSEVGDRLSSLMDASRKGLLCGDVNTDARRIGRLTQGGASVNDTARHASLSAQLENCGVYRIDLENGLQNMPTRQPWQAGERAWHIDALALDMRWANQVTRSGIDNDVNQLLVAMSDHHPLWCTMRLRTTPLPQAKAPIVFKVKKATEGQWAKARHRLAKWADSYLPAAKLRVAETKNPKRRQALADTLNKEISRAMHRAYEKSIGTHKVRVNGNPFWNPALSNLTSKASAHMRHSYAACKRGEMVTSRTHAAQAKKLRADVKHAIRKLTAQKVRSVASDAKAGNMSKAWKVTRQLKAGVTGALGDSCTYKGKAYGSQAEVNAGLNKKMAAVHTYRPQDPQFEQGFHDEVVSAMPALLREDHDSPLNDSFSLEDMDVVLKKLAGRESKQPGPDGVKYWMLTRGGTSLREVVTWYYNLIWEWELVPSEWRHSHIRYLHKGGTKSKFDLDSYRPISLISCIGKAFTMLWLPRLEKQLRPHLPSEQAGFMPKSGSVEALWTIRALVGTHVDAEQGNRAYSCFADTATAFDTVWRDGLYFILYSYGVRGKMLRMVKAWHDGATAIGLWYSAKSNRIQFSQGVRQGCVIAPLLYVCFVSPLIGHSPPSQDHGRPDLLTKAFEGGLDPADGLKVITHAASIAMSAGLYVDDVCLLSPSADALQRNLHRYDAYARKWRYQLNADKFHVVPFGKKSGIGRETWSVTDQQGNVKTINDEKEADYLGATLDHKLNGSAQMARVARTVKQCAPFLGRLSAMVGEDVTSAVQMGKVEPKCVYGVAPMAIPNAQLETLDSTVTDKCSSRTHMMPRYCRKNLARFERPAPWASSKVRLEEMGLYMKLKSDPNPTRQALLRHAAQPGAKGAIAEQYQRANSLALKTGGTCRPGSTKVGKAKRKKLRKAATSHLLREQYRSLESSLPILPRANTVGRGASAIYNATINPIGAPLEYAESRRFGVVKDPRHKKALVCIRTGQVDCAVERHKWNSREHLGCPCANPRVPLGVIQDQYHVIMECPLQHASRTMVYQHIMLHFGSDSATADLTGHAVDSVLLASLGAMLPGVRGGPNNPLYATLIRLAAPKWAEAFQHVLYH